MSVVAKFQLAASQAALISTFLPAFLLSGFIYPIDQMPAAIQVITHLIPARYFMTIIRDVCHHLFWLWHVYQQYA